MRVVPLVRSHRLPGSIRDQTVDCGASTGGCRKGGRRTVTRAEINEKIRLIVFQQLKASGSEIISSLDDIRVESEFMKDLGADSLDVVEIVTSVEEEFDLLIPDDLLEQIKTVGQAIDYISTEV
jgi:acyl carrier protein